MESFIERFYTVTDTPDPDGYASLFTRDATLNLHSVTVGRDAIRKRRAASIHKFHHMKHMPAHTYFNPKEPNVALVTGTIDYDRKPDGSPTLLSVRGLEWVARLRFEVVQDEVLCADYMVWVVSTCWRFLLTESSITPECCVSCVVYQNERESQS